MGIILVISGFNRNITGKLIQEKITFILQFQRRMTGNLVTFDLHVQVADLTEDVIDLLHIALFTAAFPCEPLKFILFGLCDLSGCLVKKITYRLHFSSQLTFIDGIGYLCRILHACKGRLDIIKCLTDAGNGCFVQYL